MQRKLTLPIGNTDYKYICQHNYYVDKTLLIKDILDDGAKIILFTRPRRFGKTLNMDMLRTFFEKTDEATSKFFDEFNDGSHIIYVNSKIQDDTPLGKLMQDMYCTDPAKLNYKEFASRMKFLKYSKEGEGEMTDILDFYIKKYGEQYGEALAEQKAKEAAKKAAHRENIAFATNLLNSGMSVEFIAQNTKLSIDEVRELAAKLSA